MYAIGYPLNALIDILHAFLFLYTIVIIAASVISWVNPDPHNPIVRVLRALTDPIFRRARAYIPRTGQIDLAPLAVLLAVMFIDRGILPILSRFVAENLLGH
jgi:YggT family protein